MSYLFGSSRKAVGMVNGKPVSVRTITRGWNSYTVVVIDGKETRFGSRGDALDFLRNMDKSGRNEQKE